MSKPKYFVGIDGGGTKCKVIIEDAAGNKIAEATSGPANAARDLKGTQACIVSACEQAIHRAGRPITLSELHVGAGLAGVNIPEVLDAINAWSHPFASMHTTTDLHIACLGAHDGQDGAIIITGTGSSGASIVNGKICELGGHGFVTGDKGSGAWLGKQAITHTLEVLDKLEPASELATRILDTLNCSDSQALVALTLEAKPAFYATLAPVIFSMAETGEPKAMNIIREGAGYIDALARRLMTNHPPRFTMIGGVSAPLNPWLSTDVRQMLSPARHSPEAGALYFAKQQLS